MKRERIEYSPSYALHLFEDGSLELSVPVSTPAPGYDVRSKLSDIEIKAYKKKGIQSLREKIEDMKKDPHKYIMKPWR